MTGLVRVVAIAATEEEAWEAACSRVFGSFRRHRWHDHDDTLRWVLLALRHDARSEIGDVSFGDAGPMPRREPSTSANWFTPAGH